MVFENLFSKHSLVERPLLIFFITVFSALFGIFASYIVFRESPALVSLAFVALILRAMLGKTLSLQIPKKITHPKAFALEEYRETIVAYAAVFLGILLPFFFLSIMLPEGITMHLFSNQYSLVHTTQANNLFSSSTFESVFLNNAEVFAVSLLAAFLFGMASVYLFIIVWNASVIGVVFAVVANHTAQVTGSTSGFVVLVLIVAALPHILLELLGYFIGGVSGEWLSDWIFIEKSKLKKREILIGVLFTLMGLLFIVLGALLETYYATKIFL